MKLWDKIKELEEHFEELNPKQRKFVENLIEHLNPNNPDEELSLKQIRHIDWLYKKYVLGEEEPTW